MRYNEKLALKAVNEVIEHTCCHVVKGKGNKYCSVYNVDGIFLFSAKTPFLAARRAWERDEADSIGFKAYEQAGSPGNNYSRFVPNTLPIERVREMESALEDAIIRVTKQSQTR